MLNQVVLVGRLVKDVEIKEIEDGKKVCNIIIACPRSFKNKDGVYDTDFINCTLWDAIAKNTAEYCKKGDIIGIKGRLQSTITSDDNQTIDENQKYELQLIAEKVTFLSSKKEEE